MRYLKKSWDQSGPLNSMIGSAWDGPVRFSSIEISRM